MKTELLAPGGSYEGMKMALRAGADAIYIGGPMFGARAYADNPDLSALLDAIDYCHLHGKKLYLTVNTLLKDQELEGALYNYLKPLYEHGLDAVLVQDTGVFSFIREYFPDQEIHASTQMSLSSVDGARLLKDMGASRIVPAREISLQEIRAIHDNVDIEIESFIHGAMCYSYSGQCLMSSMIGGRSGNRGRCAQPCRMEYKLSHDGKPCSADGAYLMSLKDTNTLQILPDLIENGVYSMKIEGRMKRPEYAAGVVRIYRKYIDLYEKKGRKNWKVDPEDNRMLMDLYNRGGFSQGYFQGWNSTDMMTMDRPNHAGTEAVTVESAARGALKVRALEPLHKGDVIESGTRGGNTNSSYTVKEDVPKGGRFTIGGKVPAVKPGQILRRTRNDFLLADIRNACDHELQEAIEGRFMLRDGIPASLFVQMGKFSVSVKGPVPDQAQKRAVTAADVEKQLRKTGGTAFTFEHLDLTVDDGLFFPMQTVNEMRREALSTLEQKIKDSFYRTAPDKELAEQPQMQSADDTHTVSMTACVSNAEQTDAVLTVDGFDTVAFDSVSFMDRNENPAALVAGVHAKGRKAFLVFPPLWRMRTQKSFRGFFDRESLEAFDGFILNNAEQLEVVSKLKDNSERIVIAGERIYTYNKRAEAFLASRGADLDTVPLELNFSEIRRRGAERSHLIVYGYEPVMMTAQCLVKNTEGCRHKPGVYTMTDRKGASMQVFNHCSICTNIICNSQVLNLLPAAKDILSLRPASLRFDFTTETAQETQRIAQMAEDVFVNGQPCRFEEGTRGHFRRGVE